MPLGVRDFLLVIRAKDQASRVVADVGRGFSGLSKKSTASMREAQNALKANNRAVMNAFREDARGFQETVRRNHAMSAQLSTSNSKLRIQLANATSRQEAKIIADEIRNNVLRKSMLTEQSLAARQALNNRRTIAQDEIRMLRANYDEQKREFDRHNASIQAKQEQALMMRQRGAALLGVGAGFAAVGGMGVAGLANATMAAVDYNKQAAKTATQAQHLGISVEEVGEIGRRVAKAIPAPFEQMQDALYDIFSSMNVNEKQAEQLLKAFAKAAVAGVTDVETASQAAISFLNAFKLPPTAENIARVMNAQFETVRLGRIEYDELARTIGRAIPSAVRAGQTIEDLGGMIAFLTRNGLSAAMANTGLARSYDLLANPKFRDRLEAIGVAAVFTEGPKKGQFRRMQDVLTDLRKAMDNVSDPAQARRIQEFFGSMIDDDALKFLEDLGIQTKETVGGKTFAADIKKNQQVIASLNTKNAQLRVKMASTSAKGEKKAIQQMIAANSEQAAILRERNVNLRASGSAAKDALRPVSAIMADLNQLLKDASPEEASEIMHALTKGAGGTIQAMRPVNLALHDTDDLMNTLTTDVNENKGAFEAAYKVMRETPSAKIQDLKNKWQDVKITIGTHLIPVLETLIEKGKGILKWYDDLTPKQKEMITQVALLGTAFFILAGFVTLAAGAFLILNAAMSIGLLGKILLLILAIGVGVKILLENWDEFKLGLRVILAEVVDLFLGLADSVLDIMARTFGWIPGIGGKLRKSRDDFREWREGVYQDISGLKPPDVTVKFIPDTSAIDFAAKSGFSFMGHEFANAYIPSESRRDPSMGGRRSGSTAPGRIEFRQHGGMIRAGRSYIVGERKPEVFQASENGYMYPSTEAWRRANAQSGSGTYITVNASTDADPEEIAFEVAFASRYGL